MDEDKKTKPELTTSDSSWVDSASYFFGTDEFSWNLQKQSIEKNPDTTTSSLMEFDRIEQRGSENFTGSNYLLPENCSSSSSTQTVLAGMGDKPVNASTSLVSSSSSDEHPEKSTGSDGKPPDKPSKGRKKGQKRTRQQRFAFMTKSDVDHLEDGYRWRKYGQKAVKNSPYPRSYYRCTNSKCTVKKRVERSCEDPSIVITTYEGQHCHHTVSFPRGGIFSHEISYTSGLNPSTSQLYTPALQYPMGGQLAVSQLLQLQQEVKPNQIQLEQTLQNTSDEGLLGDIVPPRMRNR